MAHDIIINIPAGGDVLRFPPFDDPEVQARRIAGLRAAVASNPAGLGPQHIPGIINWIDDAQDMIQLGVMVSAPLFRHLSPEMQAVWGGFADLSRSLNAINTILEAVQAGRVPKRQAIEQVQTMMPGRPALPARAGYEGIPIDPLLFGGFNPLVFLILAGQVLYNWTGYGLCLGAAMQLITSQVWVGLDLVAGRQVSVVLPPPAEPIQKAREFMSQWGPMSGAFYVVDAADQALLATAALVGIDILTAAPVLPQYTPFPQEYGTTVYHYDRFRGVVENDFVQLATPFVEYTSLLPDATVYQPNDPRLGKFGLPVRWPWNPVASEQLTRDPRNYLPDEAVERLSDLPPCTPGHTGSTAACSWVKFWDDQQSKYIEWDKTFGPYAQKFDQRLNELAATREAYNALAFEVRHSVYDFATWYNNNRPLFQALSRGEERLMAIAIEENVFPATPASIYNYTFCSEPYDPPTRTSIVGDPVVALRLWFDRARYLWHNPGAPFFTVKYPGAAPVEWVERPFPGRTGRAAALIAASYELWGARYYRPDAGNPLVPYWANWQLGIKPSGIYYGEPGVGAVAGDGTLRPKLRFKSKPDNSWADCTPPVPVPPGPCYYIVLPDGTFILRCPGGGTLT